MRNTNNVIEFKRKSAEKAGEMVFNRVKKTGTKKQNSIWTDIGKLALSVMGLLPLDTSSFPKDDYNNMPTAPDSDNSTPINMEDIWADQPLALVKEDVVDEVEDTIDTDGCHNCEFKCDVNGVTEGNKWCLVDGEEVSEDYVCGTWKKDPK